MRVLMVHNYYRERGGEGFTFAAERDLLLEYGHDVETYTVDNAETELLGPLDLAGKAIWSRSTHRDLARCAEALRPDVAHFHNTFPLVSPSGYSAVRNSGAAVVQSIHNYRLACPNGLFFRNGRVCTDCDGKPLAWPGVLHACYRQSRPATAAVAAMLSIHRLRGTWKREIDRYITLTEFQRRQLARVLPANRTVVKPNFIHPDPGPAAGNKGYALYVGRLSPEKGITTLVRAWCNEGPDHLLRIAGDGPLADEVAQAAQECENIESLGQVAASEVLDLVGGASLLVFPSGAFEGFPRTILEALSRGTPVLASDVGAAAEIVDEGRTGALFRAGDPDDLRRAATELLSNARLLRSLRSSAREEYELKYTGSRNLDMLLSIYKDAIETRRARAALA